MKVILKENVYKHGVAGDVVNVADGFARNYLIPRGLAVKATAGALRDNAHLMAQAALRRTELNTLLNDVSQKIDGVELVFGVKAGKNNKLYGSITTADIARALEEKTGIDINRRRISEKPLRELGVHDVPVRMSASVVPSLRIVILREEEVADYLAGKSVDSIAGAEEISAEAAGEESEDAAADNDMAPEESIEEAVLSDDEVAE
ncbi:MAG: 50S ribosomal protein L9 [Anaerolineae bacterium]|nr:50S ribosomal protein L9 [Anaerolineae bacterium]